MKKLFIVFFLFLLIPLVNADFDNCTSGYFSPRNWILFFDGQVDYTYLNRIIDDNGETGVYWYPYDTLNISFHPNMNDSYNLPPHNFNLNPTTALYTYVVQSAYVGNYNITLTFNDTSTGTYCLFIYNMTFGNVSACNPPENIRDDWVIDKNISCQDMNICRKGDIIIEENANIYLLNSTIFTDFIFVSDIYVYGFMYLFQDSYIVPFYNYICGSPNEWFELTQIRSKIGLFARLFRG